MSHVGGTLATAQLEKSGKYTPVAPSALALKGRQREAAAAAGLQAAAARHLRGVVEDVLLPFVLVSR
jgi:hypothetical protein